MEKTYIVMAKQVPDTKKITGKAMKEDGTVNRAALPAIFNPDDMAALEMALRLKDQYGGKVVVLTMGPPSAVEILRQSLYRGVDKCVLLTDRKFAGSDTLATSMVLSYAIRKMGGYSLIISGRQAIDGDTAQVGPQVAEKLGIPQITYVEDIVKMDKNTIEVKRIIENGFATQSTPMPALLTCCATSTSFVRPCSAKRIQVYKNATTPSELMMCLMKDGLSKEEAAMQTAKRLESNGASQPIEEWDISKIDLDESLCGLGGSPTWVKQIESVVLGTTEHKRVPATDAGISELISELITEHIFD
ncbi:MAG: electron transfer flavoprotein subunit beta/FixA family protein [Candidatus Auribacterota bacterium]|jgi:electron transfer flavoprotein beta subunit|nr:electron transfer flavoprotein subunit beta/FixA family protein [Candidatus Auribacterota bacterium]